MPAQSDRELISQCLSGDQEAWSRLYRRVYKTVHFITHWHKWNFTPDQTEELMQEIFMSLVTALKTFNFDSSLETFASNIAKNKCISEIRRISALKREGAKESMSMDAPDGEGQQRSAFEDPGSFFGDAIDSTDLEKILVSALNEMDEKCRTIVRLKYYDNYSYEDIAVVSQLPLGTVASRLKRCLLELRKLCQKQSGGYHETIM